MLASIRILIDADVVATRRTANALSQALALTAAQRQSFAAAVGEVAHCTLRQGGGEARFEDIEREGLHGLRITFMDHGPGPLAFRHELESRASEEGVRREADRLVLTEATGGGTLVELVKWEDPRTRRLRDRARDLV